MSSAFIPVSVIANFFHFATPSKRLELNSLLKNAPLYAAELTEEDAPPKWKPCGNTVARIEVEQIGSVSTASSIVLVDDKDYQYFNRSDSFAIQSTPALEPYFTVAVTPAQPYLSDSITFLLSPSNGWSVVLDEATKKALLAHCVESYPCLQPFVPLFSLLEYSFCCYPEDIDLQQVFNNAQLRIKSLLEPLTKKQWSWHLSVNEHDTLLAQLLYKKALAAHLLAQPGIGQPRWSGIPLEKQPLNQQQHFPYWLTTNHLEFYAPGLNVLKHRDPENDSDPYDPNCWQSFTDVFNQVENLRTPHPLPIKSEELQEHAQSLAQALQHAWGGGDLRC